MGDELLIPVRLSHEGFGGTPQQIADMPTAYVLAAVDFLRFKADYTSTVTALNKDTK